MSCVEGSGWKASTGYRMRWNPETKRDEGEHRQVWSSANGRIPDGMVIMHTCDNRGCVNLQHLQLGTYQENNQDCLRKGRGNRRSGISKLTEETAVYALARMLAGEEREKIASFFGIDVSSLSKLWTGVTWRRILR